MSTFPGSAAARLIGNPDQVRLSTTFPTRDLSLFPETDPYLELRRAMGFLAENQDFHVLGALRCLQAFPQFLEPAGLRQLQDLNVLRFFEPPAVQVTGATLGADQNGPPVVYITPAAFPTQTTLTVTWHSNSSARVALDRKSWIAASRYVDGVLIIEDWPAPVQISGQFKITSWISGTFFTVNFWPVQYPAALAVEVLGKRYDLKVLLRDQKFLNLWLQSDKPEEKLSVAFSALLNHTNKKLA